MTREMKAAYRIKDLAEDERPRERLAHLAEHLPGPPAEQQGEDGDEGGDGQQQAGGDRGEQQPAEASWPVDDARGRSDGDRRGHGEVRRV